MSTAYVHASIGVLAALALRYDWRLVAPAAFIAESPDLDHLWGTGGRQELHTVWYLIVLPALVAGLGLARATDPRWTRFFAGLPVLPLTHALLDLFPQATETSSGHLPLFQPLDGRDWLVAPRHVSAAQPAALSSLGIVCGLLAAAVALALLAGTLATRWRSRGYSPNRFATLYAAACIAAFLLVVQQGIVRPA